MPVSQKNSSTCNDKRLMIKVVCHFFEDSFCTQYDKDTTIYTGICRDASPIAENGAEQYGK